MDGHTKKVADTVTNELYNFDAKISEAIRILYRIEFELDKLDEDQLKELEKNQNLFLAAKHANANLDTLENAKSNIV